MRTAAQRGSIADRNFSVSATRWNSTVKIIFSKSVVGNDTSIVDRVNAELRATGARFDSRQLDRHRTMFEHIAWDDLGIGSDPFWRLEISAGSRGDERLVLWARSNVGFPDERREQVEQVLRQANSWRYCDGSFTVADGSNGVRFATPPVKLEDLDYGLRGAFECIDDLLAKVTPALRKAMSIAKQPSTAFGAFSRSG